jgi:hypothetical protein
MEAISSSETSAETQRTTRRHIPEDDTLSFLFSNYLSRIYLFIYGLFNGAVSSQNYITSACRVIDELERTWNYQP